MKPKHIIMYFLVLFVFIFGVANITSYYDDIKNKFYEIEPNLDNYSAAEILFLSYERFINSLLKYDIDNINSKNDIQIKKSLLDSKIEIIKNKTKFSSIFFAEEDLIHIIESINKKSLEIDDYLDKLFQGDINKNDLISNIKGLEIMLKDFQELAYKIQIDNFNKSYSIISSNLNKAEIYLILFFTSIFIFMIFIHYHIVILKKGIFERNKVIKDKNIFISTIYHEISSPLQSIIMAVDLFDDNLDKKVSNELLQSIKKLTNKIYFQTKEVFEYSKYEIGVVSLNYELFNLNEIVKDLEDNFQTKNTNKLVININNDINDKNINSDKNKLQKIINNLVDNANKNTINGIISISVKVIKNILYIRIKDNGKGFSEQDAEWFFIPFNQGGEKKSKQGLGLGLTIVKLNIDLLKGKIKVKSKIGKGTSFMMCFPLINLT